MNDDFLLDEDDDGLNSQLINNTDGDDDYSDEENEDSGSSGISSGPSAAVDDYSGKMTEREIGMSSMYNNIMLSNQKNREKVSIAGCAFDGNVVDAVNNILTADPMNTSSAIIGRYMQSLFHAQGHTHIVGSVYQPEPLRAENLDSEFGGVDDSGFNDRMTKDLKVQISRFVEYLATRDLSRDGTRSRNFKQRQLPAFIIFMFTSGLYDFIINCPTMPPEYQSQIDNAMRRINQNKYNLVEDLASEYESRGRSKLAEKVRQRGLSWFNKEPAEITSAAEFRDLEISPEDTIIYKEYRSKFINTSRAITLDTISKLILVVLDKDAGIYEELKDKTRTDAINDAKQVYKEWASKNPLDSELANEIIWGTKKPVSSGLTKLSK